MKRIVEVERRRMGKERKGGGGVGKRIVCVDGGECQ